MWCCGVATGPFEILESVLGRNRTIVRCSGSTVASPVLCATKSHAHARHCHTPVNITLYRLALLSDSRVSVDARTCTAQVALMAPVSAVEFRDRIVAQHQAKLAAELETEDDIVKVCHATASQLLVLQRGAQCQCVWRSRIE